MTCKTDEFSNTSQVKLASISQRRTRDKPVVSPTNQKNRKQKLTSNSLNKRPKIENPKRHQIIELHKSRFSSSPQGHYPDKPPLGKRSNQISPPVPATHRLQASSYASSRSLVHRAVSKSALLQRARNSIRLNSINLPLPLPLTWRSYTRPLPRATAFSS